LHGRSGESIRQATAKLKRVIVTPQVSKHRLFVWQHPRVYAESTVLVTASDSDAVFGVLHSRFHEMWSLRMCTWMGKGNDPRYTPTTCFETFPFPFKIKSEDGLQANLDQAFLAIAAASQSLCALRDRWLNPPEYTRRLPEVLAGYPERILPRDDLTEAQLAELKKRTLTNLYNLRPSWLKSAHETLDAAVAVAYGWADYSAAMSDEVILGRLLGLNSVASAS
jgi:type II restriction/modification system DNA methylase subunit YeeA